MNQREYDLQSRVSRISHEMGFVEDVEFLKDKEKASVRYEDYEIAMGMRDESPPKLRFPVPYGSVFNSAIVSGMISAILR
tara:strand:- start:97 stop:336 length:240 start_codon:yes stop_codon:yes gene_type:complete